MFVELLFTAIGFLAYFYYRSLQKCDYWKNRGVKGPKPIPLFGNILENFKTPINELEEQRFKLYGRVYGFFEFGQPLLTVGEPELLKQMAVKDFHVFMNNLNLLPGDPLFSKMLGNLRNEDWRRVRTIVSATFTTGKIKRMTPYIEQCLRNALSNLEKIAEESVEIDLKKLFGSFTLDVIAKCAFATNTNAYKDPQNKLAQHADSFLNFKSVRILLFQILPISVQKAINFQVVREETLTFLSNTIRAILKQRQLNDLQHKDFVQLLLDAEMNSDSIESDSNDVVKDSKGNTIKDINLWKKKLDEDEIIANCILFLLAGYETTSSLLFYCSYSLAMNEEIQQRLYNEVIEYFETHETVDYDSLVKLPYLDAVLNETLRHFPPLVQLHRDTAEDYRLADTGIIIPKGTTINLPYYAIHHDPEFFTNPHVFDPERFMPENKHLIKPYTFLPFGIGPRICVGMRFAYFEAKLFLVNVVRRFKFVRTSNTVSSPVFNSKKITLKCEPILLKVEKRVKEIHY